MKNLFIGLSIITILIGAIQSIWNMALVCIMGKYQEH